jgi:hypothetical protein
VSAGKVAYQMSLLAATVGCVREKRLPPPFGWEHLPIKATRPWKLPFSLYWGAARVTWSPSTETAEAVLRDNRLPVCEVGLRPGFEVHTFVSAAR